MLIAPVQQICSIFYKKVVKFGIYVTWVRTGMRFFGKFCPSFKILIGADKNAKQWEHYFGSWEYLGSNNAEYRINSDSDTLLLTFLMKIGFIV